MTSALHQAIQDLHLRAGKPSTRAISRLVRGSISHETFSKALRGDSVPTWPVFAALVNALGGNLSEYRELWVDAQREAPAAPVEGDWRLTLGPVDGEPAVVVVVSVDGALRSGDVNLSTDQFNQAIAALSLAMMRVTRLWEKLGSPGELRL